MWVVPPTFQVGGTDTRLPADIDSTRLDVNTLTAVGDISALGGTLCETPMIVPCTWPSGLYQTADERRSVHRTGITSDSAPEEPSLQQLEGCVVRPRMCDQAVQETPQQRHQMYDFPLAEGLSTTARNVNFATPT